MAKLYSAIATGGKAPRPEIAHLVPQRKQVFSLSRAQDSVLLEGLKAVLEAGGTAGASAIQGLTLGGKTGRRQKTGGPVPGGLAGVCPARNPRIGAPGFLRLSFAA